MGMKYHRQVTKRERSRRAQEIAEQRGERLDWNRAIKRDRDRPRREQRAKREAS